MPKKKVEVKEELRTGVIYCGDLGCMNPACMDKGFVIRGD